MSMCHLAKTSKLENKNELYIFNRNSTFHSRMRSFVSAEKWPKKWNHNCEYFFFSLFALHKYCAWRINLHIFRIFHGIRHGNFNLENCSHKEAIGIFISLCMCFFLFLFLFLHAIRWCSYLVRRLFSRINKRNNYFFFRFWVIAYLAEKMIHLLQQLR